MNTILTDDEIQAEGRNGFGIDPVLDGNLMKFARAVEAAVLAKLAQQEPVGYMSSKGRVISAWLVNRYPEYKHDCPIPLYTHPTPQQADHQRVPADLKERCAEILHWKKTALLKGEALRNFADRRFPGEVFSIQMAEAETANEAFRYIAATPEAPAQADEGLPQGWIALSDRRPEPEVYVLAWDGKKVSIDWWGSLPKPHGTEYTHWMPFPKPPGAGDRSMYGMHSLAAAPEAPAQRKKVGDSSFESWFSEDFDPKNKSTKQQMREAYEAGMNDTAPAPAQSVAVDEREAFDRALSTKPEARFWNATDAMFWAWQARAALAQKGGQA